MSLEQIRLDNLTWAEMVTAIRRRIPSASAGDWTLHAPVDPGVTLLELFAFLLEQRVFWMDQIPDSLVHAALGLMGESVRTATAASTVMRIAPRPFEKLDALTQVRLTRSVPPLIFSTDDEVLLLPAHEVEANTDSIGLSIGKDDRTLDLLHERRICLLPADAASGDVKIVLWLTEQVPSSPAGFGDFFSLFVELETPESIPSQWLSGAVANVSAPATLSWSYLSSNSGALEPFPADAVEDGTGGLRRSGIVRFKLPGDWEREQPGPSPPTQWPYAILLRIDDATFSFPPVLKRIVPNVVSAKHRRQTQQHQIKIDWLPLPGQSLALPELSTPAPPSSGLAPLQDHPPLEDTVELSLSERDGDFEGQPARTLTFRGPDERVFLVDREKGRLRFGNGLTGRVPVVNRANDPNLRVRYFTGGGEAGNIGSNRNFEVVAKTDVLARNIVAAEGGAEPESLDSARRRAASALRRVERAITALDHERVVLETPGVAFARAHAALGHHPLHPCRVVPGAVTIYVLPEAPRLEGPEYDQDCAYVAAPQPDEGALAVARARVETARLVGNEVFVSPIDYRQVRLHVEARGDSPDPKALSQRIRVALQIFLDPLIGGTQKQGWPFGEPLRPSVLLSEAQKAAGLDANILWVSIGLDCNEPSENCKDVEIEPHQLVALRNVDVRLEPEASSQGGLR